MLLSQRYIEQTYPYRFYLLLILSFLLAGCGVHLHRPDDAQLARTALTTFKDVKLEDSIRNESIAASEILNSEIAAIRHQSRARRDKLLSVVIGGKDVTESTDQLKKDVDKRLADLLGDDLGKEFDNNALRTWLTAQENIEPQFESVRQFYLIYEQQRKHDDPRIIRIGALLSEQDASILQEPLKTIYDRYIHHLNEYNKTKKIALTVPVTEGILGEVVVSLNAQEAKLIDASEVAKIEKAKLDRIKKERDDKITESQASGKKADEISKALKEASDETNKIISLLTKLLDSTNKNDFPGTQKKIIALEEIREKITNILPRVADVIAGQAPSSEDIEKIKILESVTAIRKGIDGIAYPKISDLILESGRLRIELERLRGIVELEEGRKALLNLQLTYLRQEISLLKLAKQSAEDAKAAESNIAKAETAEKRKKIRASIDESLVRSLAYLAESWSIGRTPAEEIGYLIIGIDHRIALRNSTAAFEQWSNLILVPLSQLVAYHESGIRSEDLANLISAAGFSAIAPGLY